MNLQDLAGEAYDWFVTDERDNENEFGTKRFVKLRDGHPGWIKEMVYHAHGDFLPDDWRYETIRQILGDLHDNGAEDENGAEEMRHEICDGIVDVYTGDRYRWLGSNLNREGYVEEAKSEFGFGSDATITEQIGWGQYVEAEEVFQAVLRALVDELERREDDDEEDEDE